MSGSMRLIEIFNKEGHCKMKTKPEVTDHQVVWAMDECGGDFVKLLGKLFRRADSDNQARIKAAWPEYWEKYTDVADRLRCPECGASNILKRNHDGMTSGVPECDFKECEDCGHQWGHV